MAANAGEQVRALRETQADTSRGGRRSIIFGARALAGRGWNAARFALAGFWLLMAGINVVVTLPKAEQWYQDFAEISWPGFDWVVSNIVQPVAIPFTLVLIVWEVGIAALVLSKGIAVRIGLLAALLQVLALAPFLGWYELPNIPLALGIWLILQRNYNRSVLDMIGR